jgi:two-component system OmpR family sensor kinase
VSPLSLRARLVAGTLAAAAAGLLLLGAVVYVQQRAFLTERVDEQARLAVPLVGRSLDGPGRRDDAPRPPDPGRGAGPPPDAFLLPPGVFGEQRDPQGRRLGRAVVFDFGDVAPAPPRLPAELQPGEVVTVAARGDDDLRYRAVAAPAPAGGTTVVAVPLSGVEAQLDRLLLVEAGVGGAVLLLLGGLSWWVVRVGLRPLERISGTARRIAAGDLSRRVEPDDPRTEVGRLGRSLNTMLHQIEGAFAERTASEERLRRFLADASHELRTPLAAIRGYAELHRMGAASDPQGAERAMRRIEQQATRMGVLVDDLLLLARLDEVRDAVRQPVDVGALARDAVEDARAAAPDREIALDEGPEDALVLGDPDGLRQVLGNLLRNALVHTPAGTRVEVAVRVEGPSPTGGAGATGATDGAGARSEGARPTAAADRAGARMEGARPTGAAGGGRGRVRLVVRDHGPGLPVEDGDVLFERLWRADPARGRGPAGAGLGLAIVRAVVAAHGGEVTARTAEAGGAAFEVLLPALSDAVTPPAASSGSRAAR